MASSRKARAHRRAEELREPAIRDALTEGSVPRAVAVATAYLRAELARQLRWHPGYGALTGAQLAGSIAGVAAGLHNFKPDRASGKGIPAPEQLLAAFEAAFEAAEGERHE